jgi:hypothetical protein
MAERRDWSSVGIDVGTKGSTAREIGPDSPFRMLIVGDFSRPCQPRAPGPSHEERSKWIAITMIR